MQPNLRMLVVWISVVLLSFTGVVLHIHLSRHMVETQIDRSTILSQGPTSTVSPTAQKRDGAVRECAKVYEPLGYVPSNQSFLSVVMDPAFRLTYVTLPPHIAFDINGGCMSEKYAVCDAWNMESHFSAEHLIARNLMSHPQVDVVSLCDLTGPGRTNATLIFFPLIISIPFIATGNNDLGQMQIDVMKDYMRTHSVANGHNVVRVDVWGRTFNDNGIALAMHGNAGSDQGIREAFKHELFAAQSRHIIIPYGHLNDELQNPPREKLEPTRERQLFLFYLAGDRTNAVGVRAQVRDGIQGLRQLVPSMKMSVHTFDDTALRIHLLDVLDSTFCPCPRGDSDDTRRIFTAILGGCIPVIASDWIVLPFEGFIDWTQFAIFSREDRIKDTILALMHTQPEEIVSRRRALLCVRDHFIYNLHGKVYPLDAIDMIMATLSYRGRALREYGRWFRDHHESKHAPWSPCQHQTNP